MYLGYNSNGLAHHDPRQAIELLAEIGYRGVGLTLDHHWLNPWSPQHATELRSMNELLERHALRSVVETGARFLLDPRQKHEPTLVSPEPQQRARRIEFLQRAIDIAKALHSDCVSCWSGILHQPLPDESAWQRLKTSLQPVVDYAEAQQVIVGFEPEPGMFIDTMQRYEELAAAFPSRYFQLTLDVGHVHCEGEGPLPDVVHRWRKHLVNVHIEDMRQGVHEHLMFGEGEMQFAPLIDAFRQVGYQGGLYVELSRHSHEGPTAARRAFNFLARLAPDLFALPPTSSS